MGSSVELVIQGKKYTFEILHQNSEGVKFNFLDREYFFRVRKSSEHFFNSSSSSSSSDSSVSFGHVSSLQAFGQMGEKNYQVFVDNFYALVKLENSQQNQQKKKEREGREGKGQPQDESAELSPMPGKIFKVLKKVGDPVRVGETILIMEAMKMEHSLKATVEGTVQEIFYREGDVVAQGVPLFHIKEKGAVS